MNTSPHAWFFIAFMHCAFTVARTEFYLRSTKDEFVKQVCKPKVIEHSCSTVTLKSLGCPFHIAHLYRRTPLHLDHLRFAYRHQLVVGGVTRCSHKHSIAVAVTVVKVISCRSYCRQCSAWRGVKRALQHAARAAMPVWITIANF